MKPKNNHPSTSKSNDKSKDGQNSGIHKNMVKGVKPKFLKELSQVMRQVIESVDFGQKMNFDEVPCEFCHQIQKEKVNMPSNAEPECIVLTNEILLNIFIDGDDVQHNITNYSVYDENMHMCSLDSGVIERDIPLYLTGYVKPIYDNASSIDGGVLAKGLGPITQWWMSTYSDDSNVLIGVCTEIADYLLIEPNSSYKKYMKSVTEKVHLSRLVIKSILNSEYDDATYEDVLNCIVNSVNPVIGNKFTEEDLIFHAQFVLNQVVDYDLNDTYHLPLANTKCIETLTQLSGAIKTVSSTNLRRVRQTNIVKRDFSEATTTELVKDVFENVCKSRLNIDDKKRKVTMNKLGSIFDKICDEKILKPPRTFVNNKNLNSVGNDQVIWKGRLLCKKMFVVVISTDSVVPLIGRIEYFYEYNLKDMAHIMLFMHGLETVLEDTSDPREIFALKKCKNIFINNVVNVLDVIEKLPADNWFNVGNSKLQDILEPVNLNNKKSFFYQLQYDEEFGRFEYPKSEDSSDLKKYKYCSNCEVQSLKNKSEIPQLFECIELESSSDKQSYKSFKLFEQKYSIGNFIYLSPGIFSTSPRSNFLSYKQTHKDIKKQINHQVLMKHVDETIYPEYYRKITENAMCESNDPFEIAEIIRVYSFPEKQEVRIVVRRMYRAEQILSEGNDKISDMNMLFWSEEEFIVQSDDICGKCFVVFFANIENDPIIWATNGPDRFYFTKKYDFLTGSIDEKSDLPNEVQLIGKEVFAERYVNCNLNCAEETKLQYIPSYKKIEPLRGLDIFAGCGGLSKGLEYSGMIKSKWAIECDDKAAAAFKLNNPDSTVFVEDCNHLLKLAMSGEELNSKNQKIPQKGDVDFICGGPPYQGFSIMNRLDCGENTFFKNSMIVTTLSFIDFYRPKFVVIENSENFATLKGGLIFQLTLRCLIRIGYQCTFGILQSGNFGVPLTKTRLIIMAAAPGEQLPLYPEPTHVFNTNGSSLTIQIGEKKFKTNCQYGDSAPMRAVTIYDALSDLPRIQNGASDERILYTSTPITHLQRLLRYPNNLYLESELTDHICKKMSPLVQARMDLIPVVKESDWRDLPNIEVQLCDETKTNKLLYTHNDIKNGKGESGILRGVCQCASGGKCNPEDRQNNTIIPWCLPHTSNTHNNWVGLYGRLAWSGFCSTITNPEPMGTQGRVLHPEQHRVVSVRECARLQGFNDSYLFYGSIINKHRQIGNAVPPPMGVAIGYEIIKVVEKNSGIILRE